MKLQAIVPIYQDPLLCELFFRNYAKYKKNHIDRLILLTKPIDFCEKPPNKTIIGEIKNLLEELNITNYKLIDSVGDVEHGRMFESALDEIYDENYHTLFDEQDAYWINDNIPQFIQQLNEYDLIGEKRGAIPYLWSGEHIEKFNKRFGVEHDCKKSLNTLSLPEFLSNRVFKKLKNFTGRSGNIDPRTYNDGPDVNASGEIGFDTFQRFNLEVYKTTNKIKIYDKECEDENEIWDIIDLLIANNKDININYGKYVLYHSLSASSTAAGFLYKECELEHLRKWHGMIRSNKGFLLRVSFLYQSLKYLNNFKYKNIYSRNFENIEKYSTEYTEKVNLHEYDCSKLLEKIL